MKNNNGVDVRKGSWTKEEDVLLTKCIQDFGEGRWHLVPLRAGLKRCRRSCRMRWLNHLRPNLKRGYFGKDEVDLLQRLHKLLGNRWTLIAGRLPGRTGNDVKNFWNTHICKKPKIVLKTTATITTTTTMSNIIIKPRPHNLTMSRSKIRSEPATANHGSPSSPSLQVDDRDELVRWWKDLLQMTENDNVDHHHSFM